MTPSPASVVAWIDAVTRAQGERPALVHDGITWTYRDLWTRVEAVARHLLSTGLRPADAVGLMGANEPAFVVNYLAIMRAGGTAVPINGMLDGAAAGRQLASVDATRVFLGRVDAGVRDALAESFRILPMDPDEPPPGRGRLPVVGANSPAAIMLTSGSTGHPKGVVHTQGTMLHAVLQLTSVFPFRPDDRSVVFLPLYACIPEQVLPVLCTGGSLEILPRFEVDRVADACTRATTFDAVPTILSRLIEHAPLHKLATLRWVLFASEPMPVALLDRWWEELPGVEMHQLYGMTEVLPLSAAPHRLLRQDPASIGRAFPTTRLGVDPEHQGGPGGGRELIGASPALMKGYYKDEIATKAAIDAGGGIRTGDLGHIDERGMVYLTGRSKDIIISGGINIAPAEIEAVAARHPAVERAIVVGVPSERWGETPVVVAVARPSSALTAGDLLAHCRSLLTTYKRPTGAGLIDSLPTTGIGKTAKDAVKKMIVNGEIDLVRI
ncbi:class I adenylate-forming enzyme family protein [Jiangella alkaliphila]|uniref:AMP-binding enzyme C-terminal domain-containing protein n=1 Tax=Jiangella alkaliphila TaxID=419479 RepID=A0A1H2IRV6_9ACTN|nr:AMP-binding protein [Jiangella alkaliphila]SDU46705.1 AMP-binding enzyme C-terminal domain-containing protein [Jiangella alkaliphila]